MHLVNQNQPGAQCQSWEDLTGLYQRLGWLRFIAVVQISCGVILSIPIFSLLISWIPIWLGIISWRASRQLHLGYTRKDWVFAKQGKMGIVEWLRISSILFVVGIALVCLVLFVFVVALVLIKWGGLKL